MMVSPFTFYRGAAKIMAADLKDTPTAGLTVQLCGDAHLSNFGAFASPERRLLFDLNDFDETLPGPFEYDVKRLAASFTIAARNNGFRKADARAATTASVAAYREAMAEFAEMRTMDIWYAHLAQDDIVAAAQVQANAARSRRQGGKRAEKNLGKARTRDSLQALSKLAELVDGRYRIVSQPPIVVPAAGPRPRLRHVARRGGAGDPRPVPRLPANPCRTTGVTCSSGSSRRRGPQGGRRRQRRDPRVDRAAPGPGRTGPAVPAGQGGDRLGAGGPPAQEPVPAAPASGWCRASG